MRIVLAILQFLSFICTQNIAGELGNAVQDAFVIAVEQQARERLQRLSALKRITPVDMSQLSIKVMIYLFWYGNVYIKFFNFYFLFLLFAMHRCCS